MDSYYRSVTEVNVTEQMRMCRIGIEEFWQIHFFFNEIKDWLRELELSVSWSPNWEKKEFLDLKKLDYLFSLCKG